MVVILIIISWILLSLLLGYIGTKRKVGFYDPFFASLILSPIIGAFMVYRGN